MSMWKYIFYPLMLLLLWHNNNLLADETDQENEADQALYVNLLDTNCEFIARILKTITDITGSGINLEEIYPTNSFADKSYKLTRESTSKDNTNIKEEYILRLFYNTNFYEDGYEINIEETPIYSGKVISYLYTKITNRALPHLDTEGMIPFIKKKCLLLSDNHFEIIYDTKEKKLSVINQLCDVVGYIANQLSLYTSIKHPMILKTFTQNNITLFELPDNTLVNTIGKDNKHDINKLLTYMYEITGVMEYLHQKNIILGEINLVNLFTLKDEIVLAGFESLVASNIKANKHSSVIICDDRVQAPEFIDYKNNGYNTLLIIKATKATDVYSLGMLFSQMLHLFANDQFDDTELTNAITVEYRAEDQLFKLMDFNHSCKLTFESIYNPSFFSSIKEVFKLPLLLFCPWYWYWYLANPIVQNTGRLKKLINIINACHSKAPEKRPTVTEVRLELCKILIE